MPPRAPDIPQPLGQMTPVAPAVARPIRCRWDERRPEPAPLPNEQTPTRDRHRRGGVRRRPVPGAKPGKTKSRLRRVDLDDLDARAGRRRASAATAGRRRQTAVGPAGAQARAAAPPAGECPPVPPPRSLRPPSPVPPRSPATPPRAAFSPGCRRPWIAPAVRRTRTGSPSRSGSTIAMWAGLRSVPSTPTCTALTAAAGGRVAGRHHPSSPLRSHRRKRQDTT